MCSDPNDFMTTSATRGISRSFRDLSDKDMSEVGNAKNEAEDAQSAYQENHNETAEAAEAKADAACASTSWRTPPRLD